MQDTPILHKYEMQSVKLKKTGCISPCQTYQAVLLQSPLLTPILVSLEKSDQTAVAVRVDDLFSFRRHNISIVVKPVGYQGKEGIWVIAIVFAIARSATARLEGAAYLNPRRIDDYRLLQQLTKQERMPLLFLSPRLKVTVEQSAGWSVQYRQEVRTLLARIDPPLSDKRAVDSMDTEFERARAEFQALYSVKTLLTVHPQGEGRVSSSFSGVVLD